jgi:hypothetical protein
MVTKSASDFDRSRVRETEINQCVKPEKVITRPRENMAWITIQIAECRSIKSRRKADLFLELFLY